MDAAQSVPHLPTNVRDPQIDFLAFSGHKLYGPTCVGVLYGRRDVLNAMPTFRGGGEMIDVVAEGYVTYNDPPHRFEAGTPPILEAIGLGAALEWMTTTGVEAISAHELRSPGTR